MKINPEYQRIIEAVKGPIIREDEKNDSKEQENEQTDEKIDYKTIFELYHVTDRNRRHELREKLRGILIEEYNKSWGNLSESQKLKFIYFDIKEEVINRAFVDLTKQKTIRREIDKKIHEKFGENIIFLSEADEYNKTLERIYHVCDKLKDTETDYEKSEVNKNIKDVEKVNDVSNKPKITRTDYEKFEKDFEACNLPFPKPSKKEWMERPLRIYDYLRNFYNENILNVGYEDKSKNYEPEQATVDHVILRIIMKYLEDEYQFKIYDSEIEEYMESSHENENYHSIQTDVKHEDTDKNNYFNQAEINHAILRIVLKYLENEHHLKINIPLIKECLAFIELHKKTLDFDDFEKISIEGWEKGTNPYIKWIYYSKMLMTLPPFYQIEEKKKRN